MNPGSNSGKSKKFFQLIFDKLDQKKIDYDYKIIASFEEAFELSISASKADYDVIVAIGGDGTINKVLNGFYDDCGSRISEAKLGIIYTGTSPDFCKSYNIPVDIESALQVLLDGNTNKISIGRIRYAKKYIPIFDDKPVADSPEFLTGYFGCCANIGIGASIARYANSGIRKFTGDFVGTFVSMIRALIFFKSDNFVIIRDGIQSVIENVYNISIGKTALIASGIKVKNDLEIGDVRFYNLIVRNLRLSKLPYCFNTIYSGKSIINNKIISLEYSEQIDILGNSRNPEVEFDGDPAGFLPCRIDTAKDKMELIVKK